MDPHEYLDTFKNYEASLDKLGGKEFDLSRVSELLDLLGGPQKDLRIIHVAGSKGKGSTCVFLAYILAAAGFRTGLYTSPHLHAVNERLRLLDKAASEEETDFAGAITNEQLSQVLGLLRPHIAAMTNRGSFLTYFEVLTAAALVFFSRAKADWVVLETGLGGRLDATNAAESMIAVITPISLEHTNILGGTLAKIAAEKSGIIKNSRQRVIIAPQPAEALTVILKRCQEFGIPPIMADASKSGDFKLGLKGEHQRTNASTALCVVELLRQWAFKIPDEAVARGLKHTRWPGRFEILRREPLVIADGAHNVESARCLVKTLAPFCRAKNIIYVIGLSADKDIAGFIGELQDSASMLILTQAGHARAHRFTDREARALLKDKPVTVIPDAARAFTQALAEAGPDGAVVITGSLYLVADARNYVSTQTTG